MPETIERNATAPAVAQQPRLLDQVRAAIRTRHYSLRTEQAYCHWIKRWVSRARLSAARSHSFPPRRSYFARSASVTRSRIIAVCASSGGSAGRPRGFFGAALLICATQVLAQRERFAGP